MDISKHRNFLLSEIKVNEPYINPHYIKNVPFDSWEDAEVAWQDMWDEVENRLGNTNTLIKQQELFASRTFYDIVDENFEEKYGVSYFSLQFHFDSLKNKINKTDLDPNIGF